MKNFLKAWAVSLLVDLVLIGLLEWGKVEEFRNKIKRKLQGTYAYK